MYPLSIMGEIWRWPKAIQRQRRVITRRRRRLRIRRDWDSSPSFFQSSGTPSSLVANMLPRSRPRRKQRLLAHLAVESDVREPFQRLADTGLRLNAQRTSEALHAFVVEEATEL